MDSLLAVSWVTGSVGDEDAIEVVRDLVDGVVEGEAGDAGASGNKAAEDVLLDTAVDQGDVHVAERGADVEGSLGRDTADQVNGFGVDIGLVLIGIVFLTNSDTGEGGTLFTEVGYDLTGVNTRDGGDTLASAPLRKRLNGSPVAVPQSIVLNDNARCLDVRRLKVTKKTVLIASSGRNTVVANQRLGEDQNLAAV